MTYRHFDAADEGFPGNIIVFVMYWAESGGSLKTSVQASVTELTPIMTRTCMHFSKEARTFLTTVHISAKVVATDSIAIPTCDFISVDGTVYGFTRSKRLARAGTRRLTIVDQATKDDICVIYNENENHSDGVSKWSKLSEIRVDITTDPPAIQVSCRFNRVQLLTSQNEQTKMYTAYWLDTPRKGVHDGPSLNYTSCSAAAIEQEGYIDAINSPEWGIDQIYGPGKDFEWSSNYQFSVVH